MKQTLVDTDILSMYFRGNKIVESNFDEHFADHGTINLSIITYYEIMSGLMHKDARKQSKLFLEFAQQNTILPLTEESATISSELYADLRKQGQPVDDINLLIAGIALSNNFVLATNSTKHFGKIDRLELSNWSH